jgi:anaerobic selenocysteine-containing dehydrogenase/Fe-S-cluster-containing dehydrogenase component
MSETPSSTGVKRRDFLKILGTTTAVAGCNMDEPGKLIPYLVSPDNTVPGVSTYYATTCRECSAGCGIISETRDGRAIKLEGNPQHPVNRGALCAHGQAALQGLYNPDRFRGPMLRRNNRLESATWGEAAALLAQRLRDARADGSAARAVFINQHESGSFPAFLDQWLSAFGVPAHLPYHADGDMAAAMAHEQAYGAAWPRFDFSAARLIVSFGADFLDGWGASVPQQLDFADARATLDRAPRFIYIGPRRSLTGLNADEWIDCKPGSELAIARAVLGGGGSIAAAATSSGVSEERLTHLANEIAGARPALVLASGTTGSGGELATTVATYNRAAGNVGTTIRAADSLAGMAGGASYAELTDLVTRMNNGQVSMLFVRGVNPVYSMPKAAGFGEAMAKVPFKVGFSSYPDETTELCDLILPDHHALEQWGDAEPLPGTLGLQQPVMDPVFNTVATADVMLAAAKTDPTIAGRFTQATYRDWLISRFPGGATAFAEALTTGLARGTPARTTAVRRTVAPAAAATAIEQTDGDFYFVPYPSPTLGFGEGANKPWLQELPDPVSKICWQSWVEIHPLTARNLGIDSGDHVTIRTSVGEVTAPAFLYLGIRQDTVAMPMGQGHTAYGRYAKGIGVNALDAAPSTLDPRSGAFLPVATKARVTKAGGHSRLVTTEGSARQHGRGIARAILASQLGAPAEEHGHEFMGDASHEFLPGLRSPVANDAQGDLGSDLSASKGMYDPNHWSGMAKRRWAMTIDLARCTGCSACMTACYAENNIPTVGAPHQGPTLLPDRTGAGANITRSREMTWIRIERYFEGGEQGENDFETRFIPMLCQHCGNAPCEPVCPVYATYHAPDGLNVQVYNRCVGTRYCSNNCPYKVRYFNWFGYGEPDRPQYAFPEPLNWQLNPDVTVRGKGVMEKCTFCVQRIREAENRATVEKRPLQPDEFTVACAQACPSRAITFGDASEAGWAVNELIEDRRAYHVFEELNTFTAVVYLQKVNHPAPGTSAPAAAAGAPHGE